MRILTLATLIARIVLAYKIIIVEVWNNIRKGVNVVLWCYGLRTRAGSKRQPSNDDDDISRSARKDTQERVQ